MKTYAIIRRNGWKMPGDLEAAAARSTDEGDRMSDDIRWIRSYVMDEHSDALGTVCIYQASSEDAIRKHAEAAGLLVSGVAHRPKTGKASTVQIPVSPLSMTSEARHPPSASTTRKF